MKLNGSLVLDAISGQSEIKNLRVEKLTSLPTWTNADVGRLVWIQLSGTAYIGTQTGWSPLATGGDAAALQAELNQVESALGAAVNSDGTFNNSGFNTNAAITAPTSFTNAINQLAAYATSNNGLRELDDVQIVAPVENDFLAYNAATGEWVNRTKAAAGIQPLDGDLTAIAQQTGAGYLVRTGADTWTTRQITAPNPGITVVNGDGQVGNITITASDDLAALEGLSSFGFISRTGDGNAATRSIQGVSGRTVISNGDGVAANPTVDLAAVTAGVGGSFSKFDTDAYGRVNLVSAVTAGDIDALVGGIYVDVAGDTMTGALNMGNNRINSLSPAVAGTDAVNKNQLDAAVTGLAWKTAVAAATRANVNLATGLAVGSVIDGVVLATGNRVLVKDQTNPAENGIYVVGTPAVRSSDMNEASEFEGSTVYVSGGAGAGNQKNTGWTQTETVVTLGVDQVIWSQFSGSGTYTAGIGLQLNGNTFDINLGAGVAQLPTDEVGIDLFDTSSSALILTVTGSSRSTAGASKLHLLLPTVGALEQDASGLHIKTGGVTNTMLENSIINIASDTHSGFVNLGGTISVTGDSTGGIQTSGESGFITITALEASTTQRGTASFNSAHFSVVEGNVSLNATLDDLTNVSSADAAATGSILQKTAGDWQPVSAAAFASGISLSQLSDVDDAVAPTIPGRVIAGDGTSFVSRKMYHLHDETAASTTWTVTHNIGQKYCNVTVVDSADEVIIPQSITFDSVSTLTVTFSSPVSGKVVVMGMQLA